MELLITGTILIVMGLFALLYSNKYEDKNKNLQAILLVVGGLCVWFGSLFIATYEGKIIGREEGEKNVLRGNPSIKMEILYKEVNGEFIPTDTLFINIK